MRIYQFAFHDRVSKVLPTFNQDPKEYLTKLYTENSHTQMTNLITLGHTKSMGFIYDFSDELKKFLYKQYGQWHEAFAPNKTLLRKCIYGRIDQIVEL